MSANGGEAVEAAPPLVIRDLVGWYAMSVLALGRETGMLAAVVQEPVTAGELAAKASVDEKNAAWLAAMAAHGYLRHRNGTFVMPSEEADAFRGFPFDLLALIDFTRGIPAVLPELADAIRTGNGVAPAAFHRHLGDTVARTQARLYELMLVGWLQDIGVGDRLREGEVLEIAFGTGAALLHLAAEFRGTRFTGYELDPVAVERASAEAAARGLDNVQLEVRDAHRLDRESSFGLVLILDAFHHFGRPDEVLASVRRALRPGGSLVMAEATASGDLDADLGAPMARILFSSNLLLCLQEGLHGGGAGLGNTWGTEAAESLLAANAYEDVRHHDTGAGFTLIAGHRGD